jgi:hypothetical protein
MAHQSPRSRHPLVWAAITILIAAPLVGTLWVPFYDRTTPKVADFPFFYWYLLMWVPIVAITSGLAYALAQMTKPRRGGAASGTGAARRDTAGPGGPGGPAGPGTTGHGTV